VAAAAVLSGAALAAPAAAATAVPKFDHIVIVMEENHSYSDIVGSSSAPYINSLAGQGASFTNSFAVTHPSQPNYVALFSGSTQGLTSDNCPNTFSANNLGNQLTTAGDSFTGYSESMPSDGYTGCTSGEYARKHAPWTDFSDIPAAENRTFAHFPTDYSTLPTVSFVIPNLLDDMHDGTIAQGDTWLKNNLDGYAQWAKTHNSLLIVTWDEDDYSESNQIPTLFVGANVTAGGYSEQITHYSVLRTIEDGYGLSSLGSAASATPITDVWSSAG
jgi:phospholipase C